MVFPRALTPKGTGVPDFQFNVQRIIGTLDQVGTLNRVRLVGSVGYMRQLGTLTRVGSLGRLALVGSIGRIQEIGSNRVIFAAQDILVQTDAQARLMAGTEMRDRVPLGQGSTWTGSWQDIQSWRIKTYAVLSRGAGGSFSIITGLTGSGVGGLTGTYYGPTRVGAGSYRSYSFEEGFAFTRPYFLRGGASRGTVSVHFTKQV